jgi:hypothetical protein
VRQRFAFGQDQAGQGEQDDYYDDEPAHWVQTKGVERILQTIAEPLLFR